MSLLVRTSTDAGALLVRDTDDPFALAVTESTSPLALRVRESTSPLAMRVRGLFSPASLPGLAAWYDASDSSTVLTSISPDVPATDGQAVRRWLDKSGNGRHLEQGDLVKQPEYGTASMAGGFPSLTADGSNDDMKTAAFTLNQPLTAYSISEVLSVPAAGGLYDGLVNFRCGIIYSGNVHRLAANSVTFVSGSANLTMQKYFQGAVFSGTSSFHYENAFESAAGTVGTTGLDGLTVFARGGGSFTNVRVAELMIFSGAHDLATVRKVRAFLTRKWGITV
jgi:hypothetical protein